MALEANASDLFFNLDHSHTETPKGKNGEFTGYDEEKCKEHATWFCDTLYRAGAPKYDPEDVIADFMRRI